MSTEEVADYLGVNRVTIYRWCKEGMLPCVKLGKRWRIRRAAVEEFLSRGKRPDTLAGRLCAFLQVPDNVLAISQSRELLHRMDAAFFKAAEVRGGFIVKYHSGSPDMELEELRAELEHHGFEVGRLEREERFRFLADVSESGERSGELQRLLEQEPAEGRSIWVSFNWEGRLDPDTALAQQEALTEFVNESSLVVKTGVLEETLDEWPATISRRAQVSHTSTVWLSDAGLSMSRVTPVPED